MGRWSEKAPSERAARRGFGRAIDYDDAITMDTRRIGGPLMKLGQLIRSEFRAGVSYPPGTEVTLVEPVDEARSVWLVEVRAPDESLVGGASYDTFEVALVELSP